MKTRVLLADDHTILRAGLRLVLEREHDLEVVGEAADGREAVRLVVDTKPDVAIVDIAMPLLNGIEATRQILASNPRTAVAILSMHAEEEYLVRALNSGAKAYLLKDSAEADLLGAIRSMRSGHSFFSPKVRRMLQQEHVQKLRLSARQDTFATLSAREREVVQLIAEGHSNKEIANILHLSVYTVETHRGHILEKLGLRSAAEVVLNAVRRGLIH